MGAEFLNYLFSPLSLIVNSLVLLTFGLKAWDSYAKTWMAASGKHSVTGKITYTEFREQPALIGHMPNEGLICFAYRVDGALYTGTIPPDDLSREVVESRYQPGTEIPVYFAPRAPHVPFPEHPPSREEVSRAALQKWLLTPLAVANLVAGLIWALIQQAGA